MTQDALPNLPSCSIYLDNLVKETRAHAQFKYLLDGLQGASSDLDTLVAILRKVRVLADYINTRYSQPGFWKAEDDMSPLRLIAPITHDLLSMPRANELASVGFENFREIMRLALLILLCGLKAFYGFSAVEIHTLQNKFIRFVGYTNTIHRSSLFQRLQLWALVTVTMLQDSGPERSLLIGKIYACMGSLNLLDGKSVIESVNDIVCIKILAKGTVERLVQDIDSDRT